MKKDNYIKTGMIGLLCAFAVCIFLRHYNTEYVQAKVKINHKNMTIYTGDKKKLTVKGIKNIYWKSSNKRIARVSKDGFVTGYSTGKVKIYAKLPKKKHKPKVLCCKVKVKQRDFYVSDTDLEISDNKTVKVHYIYKGKIKSTIDHTDVVACKWGKKWKEDMIMLNLIPIRNGRACVTLQCPKKNKKIRINVVVKNQEDSISKLVDIDAKAPYPGTAQNNYINVTYVNSGEQDLMIPRTVTADGVEMFSHADVYVDGFYKLGSGKRISIKYYTDVEKNTIMRQFSDDIQVGANVIYNNQTYNLLKK